MIKLLRTNSENTDFIKLVKQLDNELGNRNGDEQSFYSQFNKLDKIKCTVVGYLEGQPVACGAIKEYQQGIVEVKRMYVKNESRGFGLGYMLLEELEKWSLELGCQKCVLETGIKQLEAIGLYKKAGYKQIPNYGQYEGVENSVCFGKKLKE